MRNYLRLILFVLLFAGVLNTSCAGNQGISNPETATAQAGRIIGLATQMGGYAQATQMAENLQVTATAAARQLLLDEVGQWRLLLSDSYDEDLNDWSTGSDEDPELGSISWVIEDGKYRWQGLATNGFVWWVIPDIESVSDFYLSVSARQEAQPEVGEYGLVFRQSGDVDYYLFEISDLGLYSLYLHTDSGWESLIDWTAHPSINPGAINRLAVIATGEHFDLFINDTFVAEYSDDRLPEGKAGLLVGLSNPGDAANWEFDDFEFRAP